MSEGGLGPGEEQEKLWWLFYNLFTSGAATRNKLIRMRAIPCVLLCCLASACGKPRTTGLISRQPAAQILECDHSTIPSQPLTGELRIEVKAKKGFPIPGVVVKLKRLDMTTPLRPGLEVDAQGKGAFKSLPPGSYELIAFLDGFQTAFISHIEIPPGGCILQMIVMKPDFIASRCGYGPNGIEFCSSSSITYIPIDHYRDQFAW